MNTNNITKEVIEKEYLLGKSKRYSETKNKDVFNFIEDTIKLPLSHKEKVYCYLNNITPKCKNPKCDNIPNFISFKQGFKDYCSKKCSAKMSAKKSLITKEQNIIDKTNNLNEKEIVIKLYKKELKINNWKNIPKLEKYKDFYSLEILYRYLILEEDLVCKYCNKPYDINKKTLKPRKCNCLNKEEKILEDTKTISNNKDFINIALKYNLHYSINKVYSKFLRELYKRIPKYTENHLENIYCYLNDIKPLNKEFINLKIGYKKDNIEIDYNKTPKDIIQDLIYKYSDIGIYKSKECLEYFNKLKKDINFKNISNTELVYRVLNNDYNIYKCKLCNKTLNYSKTKKGFNTYCSVECTNKGEAKIRQQNYNIKYKEEILPNVLKEYNITLLEDYKGTHYNHKIKCNECGNIYYGSLHTSTRICRNCTPKIAGYSLKEKEILNYIKEVLPNIEIIENYRIQNKEIDIYIPSLKIGIEYNGSYWHSVKFRDKKYHIDKTNFFEDKGIHLIQIFDYEYLNKKDIVLSIIKSKLGIIENKIYARKCIIKEVTSKESNKFLEENHLQGKDNAPIRYGLYYNNELVQLLTFKRTHRHKDRYMELKRSCTKLNTLVIGGFSKLLKYSLKEIKEDIITFADRRYSYKDNIYTKNNFKYLYTTTPNFFYMIGNEYKSREALQKHKLNDVLDDFNPNLSATENLHNNDIYETYDCGNYKYIYYI